MFAQLLYILMAHYFTHSPQDISPAKKGYMVESYRCACAPWGFSGTTWGKHTQQAQLKALKVARFCTA